MTAVRRGWRVSAIACTRHSTLDKLAVDPKEVYAQRWCAIHKYLPCDRSNDAEIYSAAIKYLKWNG